MKEIKAFIQQEFIETIIDEIEQAGAKDITITKVDALGKLADIERDRAHIFRKYQEAYSTVIKLEVVCLDKNLDHYIQIIRDNCTSGGDFEGRVFVYDVLQAYNTKNGKEGDKAL